MLGIHTTGEINPTGTSGAAVLRQLQKGAGIHLPTHAILSTLDLLREIHLPVGVPQ